MENIEYDVMCERYPKERLEEIVDIASEALCTRRANFTLGKDTYPYSFVKDRLLRLDASHVGYIIDCIDKNTTNPYRTWERAGKPEMTEELLKQLREEGKIKPISIFTAEKNSVTLDLSPNATFLVTVQ